MTIQPFRVRPAGPATPGLPIRFTLVSVENNALLGPVPTPEVPRMPKASEVVAQRIVADIVSRGLNVGDRFPSEREMLQQYAVSRESLREGLRLLETQGLITIRRGPAGGPVVAAVDPRNLARASALYFHLVGANYDDVFDAWQTIEPAVVRRVTDRIDTATKRQALEPVMPTIEEDNQRELFVTRNKAFHAAIAELSGNRVLLLVQQALSHIIVEHVTLDFDPMQEHDEISRDHQGIIQAIVDGEGVRAAQLMEEHIGHIYDFYRRHCPERVRDLVQWR